LERTWPGSIEKNCIRKSKDYVKVAAMIVPREVEIEISAQVELLHKVETFKEAYQLALEHIGAAPQLLESETID
jgi:hypothetical protein